MTVGEQFSKLKENWLIVLIVAVVLGYILLGGSSVSQFGGAIMSKSASYDMMESNAYYADDYGGYARSSGYYPTQSGDFAPEVEERKITKSSSMNTEIERGGFASAEEKLKSIIHSSDAYLLSQNVNNYGTGLKQYKRGYYTIKVDTNKYDSVLSQIKDIGEVTYFNENAQDITGSYQDVSIEVEVEKQRLQRYQALYEETIDIDDKLELTDRIFSQERTIKYYEDRLANMDNRVSYSTISYTIQEKQSDWANIVFVKFSDLVKKLVGSINALLSLIFVVIPWVLVALLIWWIVRAIRHRI